MTLTAKQHRALVSVSDGDWHMFGPDTAPVVIGALSSEEFIRGDFEGLWGEPLHAIHWTITPDGLTALEAAQ
jgi:hypothetical protein